MTEQEKVEYLLEFVKYLRETDQRSLSDTTTITAVSDFTGVNFQDVQKKFMDIFKF